MIGAPKAEWIPMRYGDTLIVYGDVYSLDVWVFARERARLLHEHRYLGIVCVTLGPTTRVFYPN